MDKGLVATNSLGNLSCGSAAEAFFKIKAFSDPLYAFLYVLALLHQILSSFTVKWRMSSVSHTIFTPRVIS